MQKKKTIFITGGAGSIAGMFIRTVFARCENESIHLIALDNDDTALYRLKEQFANSDRFKLTCILDDITYFESLKKYIDLFQPDFIFHTAAHKQVSLLEQFPERAFFVNTEASLHLFLLGKERDIPVVFLSSDKSVEPIGILGLSKWFAECAFLKWEIPGCVIRLPNFWDSKGAFFLDFPEIFENKGFIPLTDKQASRFVVSEKFMVQAFLEILNNYQSHEKRMLVPSSVPERNVYEFLLELMKEKNLSESLIKITGLREGEKLHEKLYWDDERLEKKADSSFVACYITVMKWGRFDLEEILNLNEDYDSQIVKLRELFLGMRND